MNLLLQTVFYNLLLTGVMWKDCRMTHLKKTDWIEIWSKQLNVMDKLLKLIYKKCWMNGRNVQLLPLHVVVHKRKKKKTAAKKI